MYFYRICASGYEETFQTIFYSSKKYTQEEFENIVVTAYQKACKEYMEQEDRNVCFALDFDVEHRIWDYYEWNFNRIMKEDYGLYSLSEILLGSVWFDLTHHGQSKDIDYRIKMALDEIEIDESCWDNNCQRLAENDKNEWFRGSCLVYERKADRIKNKSCDNCYLKRYNSSNCNGELCNSWKWDGDGTFSNKFVF